MTAPAYPNPGDDPNNPILSALLPGEIPKADDDQQLVASGLRVDPLTNELTVAQVTVLNKIRLGDTTALTGGGALLLHDKFSGKNYSLVQVEFDNTGSSDPSYSKLLTETTINVNTDDTMVVTSDTFSFTLDAKKEQVNKLTFATFGSMLNISIKITDNATGDTIKHLPSKGVFDAGIGGFDFIEGSNIINLTKQAPSFPGEINLGLSPFRYEPGQQFNVIMKASVINLKGDATVNPFLDVDVQEIVETTIGISKNFAFAYHNSDQALTNINTWEDVIFSTNTGLNGWTHAAGTTNFICPETEIYKCSVTIGIGYPTGSIKNCSIRAIFDGVEIEGSAVGIQVPTINRVLSLSTKFKINGIKDKTLKIQFSVDDITLVIKVGSYPAAPANTTSAQIEITRVP